MLRDDGCVHYLTVEWYHPGGGSVSKGWHGIGEGFWMPEYQKGRRLPYVSEAPHWKLRHRMNGGSEGWGLGEWEAVDLALADCRRIFPEKAWRAVKVILTQKREAFEPALANIDC